jgi:peptidoglycan/xylan/chitin deacetylase (PgdA/CDA1 family)
MTRAKHSALAWGVPAALVLLLSVVITLHQARASLSDPPPKRFSGSTVVLSMPSLLRTPALPSRITVAIIRDDAAAQFYTRAATLDSITRAWKDALTAVGANARIVSSNAIGSARDARVLVIPSSPCLTVATREAIDMAGSRGQGLIMTGAVGLNDAGCRHLGYGLVVAVTGASRVEPLEQRPMVYVTIPYGGPLSADIPPGSRLDLNPASQVALRLADRDALYTTYDLDPAAVAGQPLVDGALAHSTYKGARVTYWGFELRDAVARPWNRAVMSLLVRNSVAWAGKIPLPAVEPWPNNHQAAAALTQDVEDQFTNARYAADSLRAIGVPGTFFLVSNLALNNKRVSRALFKAGEVGSHTENHGLLGGTSQEKQSARLVVTQHDLTDVIGQKVNGLRPPEEQFDVATMRGWLAAGGSYLMGANDSRCLAPELLGIGRDTLVLLPRTGDDDFGMLGPGRSQNPAATASLMKDEFVWTRELGGLYALSYHSQLLSRPEHLPALALIARAVAADTTVWTATGSDISNWWRGRASLQTSARLVSANRLDITVRNRAKTGLLGAVIRVAQPSPFEPVAATANGRLLSSEPGETRVLVPFIAAGDTKTISVALATKVVKQTVQPTRLPAKLVARR